MKSILFNFISLIILLQSSLKIAAVGEIQVANDCAVLYEILQEFNAGPKDLYFDKNVKGSCCDDKIVVCDPHRGVKRIAELYAIFFSSIYTYILKINILFNILY